MYYIVRNAIRELKQFNILEVFEIGPLIFGKGSGDVKFILDFTKPFRLLFKVTLPNC